MESETKEMIGYGMDASRNHPEKQQIFYLEKMLMEAGYPYFFNFWEELKGGLWEEPGNPETDIDWDAYNFLIEIGPPAGYALSVISVCFNQKGNRELLELLDMRAAGNKENPTAEDGKLYTDLTAEGCMNIIKDFFDSLPPIREREADSAEGWWDDEDDTVIPEHMKETIRSITGIDPDEVDSKTGKRRKTTRRK